jgi:hypothetical protein
VSGVRVEVTPATFSMVQFDAARIAALVAEAATWVGLGDGDLVRVEVAEQVPLAGVALASIDPTVLVIEGGALEDPKRPRSMSDDAVRTVAVRLLARVADRRRDGFADAPGEDELSVAEADTWDVWALGRASRAGLSVQPQRWRYRFRNRHGFTDTADRVFDRLWASDHLTWSDLQRACQETAASRPS